MSSLYSKILHFYKESKWTLFKGAFLKLKINCFKLKFCYLLYSWYENDYLKQLLKMDWILYQPDLVLKINAGMNTFSFSKSWSTSRSADKEVGSTLWTSAFCSRDAMKSSSGWPRRFCSAVSWASECSWWKNSSKLPLSEFLVVKSTIPLVYLWEYFFFPCDDKGWDIKV